ncbi:hypothetical protein [Nonomuraea maritima]|uniref:hypothetical protein n=1 Tax=Nonomuraea maritima TaxID=683260 RepID=UPI003716F928
MSACILGLYRSAVPNPHADWGALAQAATPAPGLILVPADDRVDDEERSRQVDDRLRARVAVLDGMNHWWMYDKDREGRVRPGGLLGHGRVSAAPPPEGTARRSVRGRRCAAAGPGSRSGTATG